MPDSQAIPPLSIRLLGEWDAKVEGKSLSVRLSRKEQGLLATLALHSEQETARDMLAVSFWPDSEESQAKFYLRKSLSNLRRALGSQAHRVLSPTPRTVRLDLTGAFCDVLAFHAALAQVAASTAPEELLKQAVALYRGPFLQESAEDWAAEERTRCEDAYHSALESLAKHAQETGEQTAAIHWLRRLISADPYRESAVCALMAAIADSGDRAAMHQVYQVLRLRLLNDLNTRPAPETEALFQRLSQRAARPTHCLPAAPPSTAAALRHLPVPLTGLIGREEESEEIAGWLANCRLVTLLGPGGVGKTRLSITVAETALPRFIHGVWFVDLSALTDPSLVPEVAAKALGLKDEPGEVTSEPAIERLIQALAPRSLLIVMDNCEHLIDACAALSNQLLSNCPDLKILATSRQVLGLTGEQIYSVPSLTLPPDTVMLTDRELPEKDPRSLLEYSAVRLFVERAKQGNLSFALSRANLNGAAEICRRLDGIPLAIEMAAARLRSLSIAEINKSLSPRFGGTKGGSLSPRFGGTKGRPLSDRFQLLKTGSKAALPRQQTLRAALDWSYDLLSPEEQNQLNRLAVFAGGCTLEATATVTGFPDSHSCLDTLTSLIDKSLLVYDPGDNPRYRMLESIREYGKERLENLGELEKYRRAHRDYFALLAYEARRQRRTWEEASWNAQVERDYPNIRAALEFSLDDRQSPDIGLKMVLALFGFYLARGYLLEGRDWCRRFLALPESHDYPIERADVLRADGALLYYMGDAAQAETVIEAALAIYRERNHATGIAIALNDLANAVCCRGDYPMARKCLEESLVICRDLNNPSLTAVVLHGFGGMSRVAGDFDAARQWLGQAIAVYKTLGSQSEIAIAYLMLSQIEYRLGSYAPALEYSEEALRIALEQNNRLYVSEILGHLSLLSLDLDNDQRCLAYCRDHLELRKALLQKDEAVSTLRCLATLAYRKKIWEAAACLSAFLGATEAPHPEQTETLQQNLGKTLFQSAANKGAAMTLSQAIDYALSTQYP